MTRALYVALALVALGCSGRQPVTPHAAGTPAPSTAPASVATEAEAQPATAPPGAVLVLQRGHDDDLVDIAVHPSGRFVATWADDRALVWDVATRTLRAAHAQVGSTGQRRALQWSPDGRSLSITRVADVVFWDLTRDTARVVACESDDREARGRWHPSLARMITRCGDSLALLDAATGQTLWRVATRQTPPSGELPFSADGRFVLHSPDGRSLAVLDAATGRALRTLEERDARLLDAAFSPDGSLVAVAREGEPVRLFDRATGAASAVFRGGTSAVGLAFAPTGTRLAITGDFEEGGLVVWDHRSGAVESPPHSERGSAAPRWSPDGNALAVGWESVSIYRRVDGRWARGASLFCEGGCGDSHTSTSADLTVAASRGNRSLKLSDGFSGDLRGVIDNEARVRRVFLSGHARVAAGARLFDFTRGASALLSVDIDAMRPDGGAVLTIDRTARTATLRDPWTGQTLASRPLDAAWPEQVAFTADGAHLVNEGMGELTLINARTLETERTAPGIAATAYNLSPDARAAILPTGERVDVATGARRRFATPPDDGAPGPIAFSPDGARFVLRGVVYDATTLQALRTLPANVAYTLGTSPFRPDGRAILVGAPQLGALALEDGAAPEFIGPADVAVSPIGAWSPDGGRVLWTTNGRSIAVWDATRHADVLTLDTHGVVDTALNVYFWVRSGACLGYVDDGLHLVRVDDGARLDVYGIGSREPDALTVVSSDGRYELGAHAAVTLRARAPGALLDAALSPRSATPAGQSALLREFVGRCAPR